MDCENSNRVCEEAHDGADLFGERFGEVDLRGEVGRGCWLGGVEESRWRS